MLNLVQNGNFFVSFSLKIFAINFCNFSTDVPGPGSCDNGLVMWTPALEQSVAEANGLMVAPGSHLHFKNNLSWVQRQATSMSGQVQLMKLSKHLGETSDKLFSPTLELGDVLIFNKVLKY